MKILYLTPFPLQNETCEDLSHIFSTQFGYYTLKSKGVDIYWHSHNRNSLIYRLCKKMKIPQLNQIFSQLSLIGYAKNYDVVYCGFDMHLLPLALLKMVGIVKTPIFVLSHFSYNTKYTSNKIKRIYKRIERKLVYKSIEKISFANEILLNVAKQDYNVPTKHWNVANWGANLKFYDRTKFMIPPQNQYFVAAGGMNRDYYTLVEAFKKIPLYLKIFAKYKAYKNEIPQNVSFENLQANYSSIEAYQKLRFHYYNSIAILLPIDYLNDVPNGATVLVEALAMGKPIVITEADTNYIDVEREGCGLTVKRHDIQGWIDAINYLHVHEKEREKMGKRSYQLAIEKFNDEIFSTNILTQMKEMFKK